MRGSGSSETVHIPSGAYVLADSGTDRKPGRNRCATVVGGRSNNSLHYIYNEPYECSEKINECQLARPHTHHFRVEFEYSTDLVWLAYFQVFRRVARRTGTAAGASASLEGRRPIGSDFRRSGSSAITIILKINLVIAWRIMPMTLLGRETPGLPAEVLLSDVELQTPRAYAKKV